MGRLFYYFIDGERKGPVDAAQLKSLAALGIITEETEIECDGRRVEARKLRGLEFGDKTPVDSERCDDKPAAPTPPPPPVYESNEPPAEASSSSAPSDEASGASQKLPSILLSKILNNGTCDAGAVLFALSALFVAAAFLSTCIGFMQLCKTRVAAAPIGSFGSLKQYKERIAELEDERKERLLSSAEYWIGSSTGTLAFSSLSDWQPRILDDARRRPGSSMETYMDALERLDFSSHEFVGGDAYNYVVNASLFTGLGVLGVGMDVRDVGEKVRAASAGVAAAAGFACAALFASTAAVLFACGVLTRRTSAV